MNLDYYTNVNTQNGVITSVENCTVNMVNRTSGAGYLDKQSLNNVIQESHENYTYCEIFRTSRWL